MTQRPEGTKGTLVIIDDPHTPTITDEHRRRVLAWYRSVVASRVSR